MMKSLYQAYTYRWMWIHPFTLVFKVLTVLPIVFAEPNSLLQLTLAAAVEVMQLLFFIATFPFLDEWVAFLTNIGSIHVVTQLSLMSFHRVAVTENPNDDTYANLMIYAVITYVLLLIFVMVFAVVYPSLRQYLLHKKEMKCKKLEMQQKEDMTEELDDIMVAHEFSGSKFTRKDNVP